MPISGGATLVRTQHSGVFPGTRLPRPQQPHLRCGRETMGRRQGHGSPGDLDAYAERHVLRRCECGAQLSCPFENASNWRKGGMPTLPHRHSKGVSHFRGKSLAANLPWIYPMKWVHGYSEWLSFFLSCFTKILLFSDFRAFEKIRESFDVFSFKVNGRCLATLIFHLKGA